VGVRGNSEENRKNIKKTKQTKRNLSEDKGVPGWKVDVNHKRLKRSITKKEE